MKKHTREVIERQKEISSKRITASEKWEEVKNSKMNEWMTLKDKRHKNILYFNEFKDMPLDADEAEYQTRQNVKKILDLPKNEIQNADSRYIYDELNLPMMTQDSKDRMIAIKNAQDAISMAQNISRTNSMYSYNNQIATSINGGYSSSIVNPYESQILFETTSLGYQGVMIPIKDALSTPLSVTNKFLSYYDVEGINRYLVEKGIVDLIKMAIIDANVYGGGILTPVFKLKNEPIVLSDLQGRLDKFFGIDNLSLETIMCFDRYCTIPQIDNDGLYSMKLWTSLPISLVTIFEDGVLSGDWYAKFSLETTSRSKFIRPDGFGVSVFARANKAVYNYEQQIQFLNYALGQLSIVVFNSKSQDYMNGGSADHTWDSQLGGRQMQDIRSQLSAMQQSMNIERGLYLNDIEVTALNRTFAGVDSIINAMNSQASMAFGVRRDVLFGEVKSSLGYKEDSKTTPTIIQVREAFRTPITQVLKWCVLGYFAEKGWKKITDNGETKQWDKNIFMQMIDSIDVIYSDSIKTNENILKESGAIDVMKLVEGRLMKISNAINYLSNIPILNKAYETESEEYKEWVRNIDNLQQVGIEADSVEQKAITAINKAILKKENPLAPPAENLNNVEKSENLGYNANDATQRPLGDFGELDDLGIIQPRSVDKRATLKEPTQKMRKRRSKE